MQVTGVGAEGQVGAWWEAQARDEAGKGGGHQRGFLLYQEWLALSPQHLNHKYVINTHLEQSTFSYPLTNPGDDSLYS